MSAVWMARMSTDVCTTSGSRPSFFIARPASRASDTPCSLSGTSCHPVKRFSRFHVLWPWRSSTSVPGVFSAVAIHLRSHLHDLGELLSFEARASDQATVAQWELDVRLDVGGVDAAAIKDANFARGARADELADCPADEPHRLVRVLRVGVLAASDRPHRLIGDDQARRVVRGAVGEARLDLCRDDLIAAARVVVVL